MADKPILFASEMVRALLDGRKTQTRRIVKPQPYFEAYGRKFETEGERQQIVASNHAGNWFWNGCCYGVCPGAEGRGLKYPGILSYCPYGKPGDLLWVRETFYPVYPQDPGYNNGNPIEYDYRATYKDGDRLGDYWAKKKWTPSIHMPREASRITLELTDVRVERLQDISEDDAIAEGIACIGGQTSCSPWRDYSKDQKFKFFSAPSASFRSLWESINGAGSWNENPWVWVLGFKVHKMNINQFPKREAA